MKEKLIKNISLQICKTAERICSLVESLEGLDRPDDLYGTYEQFMYDEVMHIQVLTLELTKQFTDEENMDGVFTEGDLKSVIGEKEVLHREDKED